MNISSRWFPARTGFSMLEVMIAVMILTSALSVVIGTIYTLHQGRASVDEDIKVQSIAQNMVERLMGARWDDLGKDVSTFTDHNAWSWHRRATKQSCYGPTMVNPPLRDADLVTSGIITQPSGVPGLEVYLEYYQIRTMDVLSNTLSSDPTLDPKKVWNDLVGNPINGSSPVGNSSTDQQIFLPEELGSLDLAGLDPSIIMRVLVRWTPSIGGVRWHEVVVARRR